MTTQAKNPALGENIHSLIAELYPLCRSITGNGLRQTLAIVGRLIPIELTEVPSGTSVFDWVVPDEWNITDAYIKNSSGDRVVDFKRSNLHVVNYSVPVNQRMPLSELRKHLFTLPDRPDFIPYRTSYYKRSWGFCLAHNEMCKLNDGDYDVVIDSTLAQGSLTIGECLLPGEIDDEILISSHCCHPSLCNDNLSGIAVAVFLAKWLLTLKHRYTYRFLFIPGTIGAITWLALNREHVSRVKHGLVLSGIGDQGSFTYKKSRRGDTVVDRAAAYVLGQSKQPHSIVEFSPYGYDERQYCSPGFNLPVGRLSRSPFGEYPQYHTSADNLDFVRPDHLENSFNTILSVLDLIDNNKIYRNTQPWCEPQLGKRGLYEAIGSEEFAMLWMLNLSDGEHSILDIAERSKVEVASLLKARDRLVASSLLIEIR